MEFYNFAHLYSRKKREREGLGCPLGCQLIALAKGPPSLKEKDLVNSGVRSGQGSDNGLWSLPEGHREPRMTFQEG